MDLSMPRTNQSCQGAQRWRPQPARFDGATSF